MYNYFSTGVFSFGLLYRKAFQRVDVFAGKQNEDRSKPEKIRFPLN
jgi:hypothetical protein